MSRQPVGTGPLDLSGRCALVTGAASGIGRAVAIGLAAAGAHITVCDVDEAGAKAVASELDGTALVLDLSCTTELADLSLETDILVNNAGIQYVAPIEGYPPEKFALILRLMLEAPFLLTRAALPRMYANGWGRVVNIASVHGLRASPYKSAYVAAKHGLVGLSKVIALEGAGNGVTSNCVCPGYVRTPLVQAQIAEQAVAHSISEDAVLSEVMLSRHAIKKLVEPEQVASAVAYLCSPDASYITGTNLVVDGGWTAS